MRSTARWRAAAGSLIVCLPLAAGCVPGLPGSWDGSPVDLTPQEPMPVDTAVGNDAVVIDGGTCTSVIESHPQEGCTPFACHIPCTSPAVYMTAPPSSGNHYPIWAAYQSYTSPVPWGNLVHCLEHGAIVIVYNCPAGCDDEVARAQAWIDALPPDPTCISNRIVLAPDPTLDVRFAASAWTWTLRADCFDETAFTQFFQDHYGQGSEVVCGGGANTPAGWCPPP